MSKEKSTYLILFLGVLGNSTSTFFTRYSQIPSMTLVTLRMLITTVLFSAALLCTGGWRQLRQMDRGQVFWCSLSGFVFALHLVTSVEAIQHTSVAASNVLLCTEVIFVALIGLFLGSRVSGKNWALILMAFAGSVLVATGGSTGDMGPAPLYGCAMAVAGSILSAVYTLIGRRERSSGLSTTCYTFVLYLSCTLSVMVMDVCTGVPVLVSQPREYGLALGMAVLSTFMGHSLFSYSLKYLQPAHVSAGKLLVPVVSGLAAIPFFGEIPASGTLVGCVVVMLAVLIMTLEDARTQSGK